jgi:hypothetical protein
MKQAAIASAIERDLLRDDDAKPRTNIAECMSCGFTYAAKPNKGRFCSDRCRAWYDAGNAGYRQDWLQPTNIEDVPLSGWRVIAGPPGTVGTNPWQSIIEASDRKRGGRPAGSMLRTRHGYMIQCAGCQKEFESKGLRCCSSDCERRYREREGNLAVMAAAGIQPATKRKCETCGAGIPKWRNGRQVSKATRFCSARCSRKAKEKAA